MYDFYDFRYYVISFLFTSFILALIGRWTKEEKLAGVMLYKATISFFYIYIFLSGLDFGFYILKQFGL